MVSFLCVLETLKTVSGPLDLFLFHFIFFINCLLGFLETLKEKKNGDWLSILDERKNNCIHECLKLPPQHLSCMVKNVKKNKVCDVCDIYFFEGYDDDDDYVSKIFLFQDFQDSFISHKNRNSVENK